MSLFDWIGRRIRLNDGKFWSAFYGTETWAAEPVNAEIAMQVSAFWACVRLLSETIGALPLGLYERQPDGSRKARGDHDLYRLLHDQPNADHTAVEFWEGMVAHLCLGGNAFAEKIYEGRRLIAIDALNPMAMTVRRTKDGSLRYRYKDGTIERDLAEDKVLHIRGFGTGGDLGLSPIFFARQSLSANRATERAAASHFANGMRPSGFLVYKGGAKGSLMTPQQRQDARDNIIAPMAGAENAGKTGILEGDFDYRQMTVPPEAAQLLETRAFGVEEVCRIFGVPPVLIGHASAGQTMWGSGIEQIMGGFYATGLAPKLKRIEQALNRATLLPEERKKLYTEFSFEGLLRADSAARGEFYWKLFQMGVVNANWIADKENVPRHPDGERYFVNSTLVPMDQAGQKPAAVEPAAPPAPPAMLPQRAEMHAVNVSVVNERQAGATEVTRIEHDAHGRVIRMIKGGEVTQIEHDKRGRAVRLVKTDEGGS